MVIALAEGAPVSAPASAPPPESAFAARFVGSKRTFARLLMRGALRLMVTLGIYRFWLATDVRRFLWGNTLIGRDGLEYTGSARELLVGFLMAIAILVPINIVVFLAALDMGIIGQYGGAVAVVFLAFLAQFAIYRARRYRLSRTVYRGVRFHQSGSAWLFALYSLLWWGITAASLGLAYPWMLASLERYKLSHTHYGDVTGRFVGSAAPLFFRGLLMWLVILIPLVVSLATAISTVDWAAVETALDAEGDFLDRLEGMNFDFASGILLTLAGVTWSVLAAALLYPVFRAIVLRWWISGVELGGVTAESRLRLGQVYAIYARFLWYMVLFGLAALVISAIVAAIGAAIAVGENSTRTQEIIAAILFVATYVALALGYATIYQATITIRLWALSFETTALKGLAALDNVPARGTASSALGEGLAGALNVGGL